VSGIRLIVGDKEAMILFKACINRVSNF
jgi:hypothetical protein